MNKIGKFIFSHILLGVYYVYHFPSNVRKGVINFSVWLKQPINLTGGLILWMFFIISMTAIGGVFLYGKHTKLITDIFHEETITVINQQYQHDLRHKLMMDKMDRILEELKELKKEKDEVRNN